MIKLKQIIKEDKMEKGHVGKIFFMGRENSLKYLSMFDMEELENGLKEFKKYRREMKNAYSKALFDPDIKFLKDYIKSRKNDKIKTINIGAKNA